MKTYAFCAALAALSAPGFANTFIATDIPFQDEKHVPANIVSECSALGNNLSLAVEKFAHKQGVSIERTSEQLDSKGTYLDIHIVNAFSAGNAFIGHAKSVAIDVVYYKDGKQVDSTSMSRTSSGGFMGGFKGSCSVLYRTVNTLGNDVAKWAKSKNI